MGLTDLLKDGHKHFSGVDEAVMKNIEACKALSTITRTSIGPNGMNKMVVNHLGKLFLTNDAATIVKEMEVVHPAAKLVALAAHSQEEEIGDNTNLVVVMAGTLLEGAEELLRTGLHTADIIAGYSRASAASMAHLDSLCMHTISDLRDEKAVALALKSAIGKICILLLLLPPLQHPSSTPHVFQYHPSTSLRADVLPKRAYA